MLQGLIQIVEFFHLWTFCHQGALQEDLKFCTF